MSLDYEALRVVWWALIGILLMGFALFDGFDLGVAMWLPFLSKDDWERRVIINTIAPTWEGNQVWFILGGGAVFAAWPTLYAVSFSGFYLAMLCVLLALILRPVGFKYRSKLSNPHWRSSWDIALFFGGFIPSLIFGVAMGNVLQGVPFHFDTSLRAFYTGSFFALLNPFALLAGLLSVVMLAMHGAFFIQIKTEGHLRLSARRRARVMAFLTAIIFCLGGVYVYYGIPAYQLLKPMLHDGPSNPLYKEVIINGNWFSNFIHYPILYAVPIAGVLASFGAGIISYKPRIAFIFSAIAIMGIIATVGVSMFPFILPSSSDPSASLLVWDSSSSELTLFIMLIATVIFLPIVLLYTAWVYRVLRGTVTVDKIKRHADTVY